LHQGTPYCANGAGPQQLNLIGRIKTDGSEEKGEESRKEKEVVVV
jgi:hypothetical protein